MTEAHRKLPEWLNVSRETEQRLGDLCDLVVRWNKAINLISKASADQIWDRHMLDSAQTFGLAPPNARRWADLGSGGGFPGLVVAILALEQRPDLDLVLVESDIRKCVFLREAIRELKLGATVLAQRVEDLAPLQADVVSARALAPLSVLCAYAHRHLTPSGTALFLKGATSASELAEAAKTWSFAVSEQASKTDPSATVLIMRSFHHV